jgi:hypothetical protein
MMNRSLITHAALSALIATHALAFQVDLNADNDRKDQLSDGWSNWRVPSETSTATETFDNVTVTLRSTTGELASAMWKNGYDTNATVPSDGVTAKGIEIVLSGLTPGRHSLVTYHNHTDDKAAVAPIHVRVQDSKATVTPTMRVTDHYDAATAYVAFDAREGEDVVITLSSDSGNVVLNGMQLDVSDPAKKPSRPSPATLDEHAPENPLLTWHAPNDAASYIVHFGTDPADLDKVAETTEPKHQTANLSVAVPAYYWRVDTVAKDGSVTTGDVWNFRVRRLAFPGAEGYGRFAIGGRGGKVYNVTSLDDSGPGTLREAVEAEGPRTVVFRVGGTIKLSSKLVVRNPYITIAGQTAPGDGIAVRGYTFGNYGTHDSIIRYMRIRVGDESGTTMDGTGFASTDHSIMDHCSVAWSIDEGVSSRGAKNITFQRSIVTEALNIANHAKYQAGKGHSFAGSISGEIGSFHHNLVTHCAGRNWSLAGGLDRGGKIAGALDIRNNVVYNWQNRTTDGGVKRLNFVNNLYIPGPATRVFHIVKPEHFWDHDPQLYHIAGNAMEGKPEYTADNWNTGAMDFSKVPDGTKKKLRAPKELFPSYITMHGTDELLDNVLADVGANIPRHDSVDERALRDVRNRTTTHTGSRGNTPGIIDSQSDAGGYPELKTGEAPADADLDGMPDWFELKHGLNPNDAADQAIYRNDGYTNLEHYLNWIVENGSIHPDK